MSDAIFFAPLRVPVVDVRTGLMNREWYLFFQAMFLRIGGTSAPSTDDLQLLTDVEDATNDGLDVLSHTANLERAVSLTDDPIPNPDVAELQALTAAFNEDPIIARFTAQWDGLTPASGGGALKFLRADGAWSVPAYPTVPVGANPTATVGPTATNGVALTFMRSDAAPAIDLTAAYSWTGAHIFAKAATGAPTFGQTISVSAASGGIAATFYGPTTGAAGFNIDFYDTTNSALRGFIGFGTSTITGAAVTDLGIAPGAGGSVVVGTANGGAKGTQFGPTGDVTFNFKTGFNATAPIAKPTVTGSRAANAALASLLTALANYGLVTDSSTV